MRRFKLGFPFLENKPMTILQIMKFLHHSQGYNQYTFIQKYRIPHISHSSLNRHWSKMWAKERGQGTCVKVSVCPRQESWRSWGRGNRGELATSRGRMGTTVVWSSRVNSNRLFEHQSSCVHRDAVPPPPQQQRAL